MDVGRATDILWEALQRGEHSPKALQKRLTVDEGLAVQLGILDRRIAAGERQIGWKLAGTNNAAREMLKMDGPVLGYLMESGRFASGQEIELPTGRFLFECELLLTVGERLAGPGVDRAQALAATERIEAAFELPQSRVNLPEDPGLGVADDVAAWGLVIGEASPLSPSELDLADVRVVARRNGEIAFDVNAEQAIDEPFASLAWLANELGSRGRAIEPGQCVLMGAFGVGPLAPGDLWEAELSSIGSVSIRARS